MKLNGSQIIVRMLEKYGIDTVAGIPGGANLPIYSALAGSPIRHILARHEQGAGFIAQGMARSTGKTAVCLATSGPGATNLLTAIADARLDSVPIVAFTGQVPTSMIGTDAFQEIDTFGMSLPVTKHNYLVKDAGQLPDIISEAFNIAGSGRPGPVLIDVPKDVQIQETDTAIGKEYTMPDFGKKPDMKQLEKTATAINRARKPVIISGGGIISSGTSGWLRKVAELNSIPVVSTLMGLGGFPSGHRLYTGMAGMHGARHVNRLMNRADLIIALGTRFGDRTTGKLPGFCRNARIIHIDIDESEIGKIISPDISIGCGLSEGLQALLPLIENNSRTTWRNEIARLRSEDSLKESHKHDSPTGIIKSIGKAASPDTIIVTDVGQHQMWTAQAYPFTRPRTFLTSGGLGTMGFGLPAAIGAALANPDKQVICISGDGSLLMNIQELATLADHGLNVKIIIMNNGHLGLVRQQQELFYGSNYIATRFKTSVDFAGVAQRFGIRSYDLYPDSKFQERINAELGREGPCFINLPIPEDTNVYPMVAPGKPNSEMILG